jgi:hypothetical protein
LEKKVREQERALHKLQEDIALASDRPLMLQTNKHLGFLWKLIEQRNSQDSLEFVMTEHLRVQGMFWGLGALDLLAEDVPANKREVGYIFCCCCCCWV